MGLFSFKKKKDCKHTWEGPEEVYNDNKEWKMVYRYKCTKCGIDAKVDTPTAAVMFAKAEPMGTVNMTNTDVFQYMDAVMNSEIPKKFSDSSILEISVAALDELLFIYSSHEVVDNDGVTKSSKYVVPVRKIGERLDNAGGIELMRQIHNLFSTKFVGFGSYGRNLEMRWDGIGNWRG